MDTLKVGRQITALRKELGYTQERLAEVLNVSPQAVSKWENGHSLPETSLLPNIAKALDTSIDSILTDSNIQVLSAFYGDGIESCNVTNRLNKLIHNDTLDITVHESALACSLSNTHIKYLVIKYQMDQEIYYTFAAENQRLLIDRTSKGWTHGRGTEILAASYGTASRNTDVMHKIEHYKVFNWSEYHANHETFPSDPANDDKEYLTFVYLTKDGIHLVTCEEGESIAYNSDRTDLYRKQATNEYFIPNVPSLPEFGQGMECSWAAALTSALQAMNIKTTYEHVMGVSGACYRLAFCSPGWDYSSVDGLVAYDYATPGYKAYGFTPKFAGRVDKENRADERRFMVNELRNNMPVLGINLRVAPEWGVICGYKDQGADLYCRTKYDGEVLRHPDYPGNRPNAYDYLLVDNWPFIITYFKEMTTPPSAKENLINSLRVFVDTLKQESNRGYAMGLHAYAVWQKDLLDEAWYSSHEDEQLARRFSVNQFCTLALYDARKSAYTYLLASKRLLPERADFMEQITGLFAEVSNRAHEVHKMLDSGEYLQGERARRFWTKEMREKQARLLYEMGQLESQALAITEEFLENS